MQDVADAVQRVTGAAAVAMNVLLHAAPDLIHSCGSEFDYVERVEHGGGVFKVVIDRVLVPVKRVQRRDLHPGPERWGACSEPPAVGLPRAARDQVQQSGVDVSLLVTGQVDHPGQRFGAAGLLRYVVPVGSARGAVTALLSFRFPGPPAEPGVRFSPHRALHEVVAVQAGAPGGVHGVGIW